MIQFWQADCCWIHLLLFFKTVNSSRTDYNFFHVLESLFYFAHDKCSMNICWYRMNASINQLKTRVLMLFSQEIFSARTQVPVGSFHLQLWNFFIKIAFVMNLHEKMLSRGQLIFIWKEHLRLGKQKASSRIQIGNCGKYCPLTKLFWLFLSLCCCLATIWQSCDYSNVIKLEPVQNQFWINDELWGANLNISGHAIENYLQNYVPVI